MATVAINQKPVVHHHVPQQGDDHITQAAGRRRIRRRKKETEGLPKKKRKLSEEQASLLELNFGKEHTLESERKHRLAAELALDPRQVAVWFQNRRARWKNDKLRDDYSKLKASHDNILLEKCRLQAQVFKLNEQLSEAEKEIQMLLTKHIDMAASSNSLTASALTMEEAITDPSSISGGLFSVGEAHENDFYGLEWVYM